MRQNTARRFKTNFRAIFTNLTNFMVILTNLRVVLTNFRVIFAHLANFRVLKTNLSIEEAISFQLSTNEMLSQYCM